MGEELFLFGEKPDEAEELAKLLYEEMERLDPSGSDYEPWDALPEKDRRIYRLCVSRILSEIRFRSKTRPEIT